MNQIIVEAKNLIGRTALGRANFENPLDFKLLAGEIGVIIGGKEPSQLLRLIMGIGEIEQGELEFLGERHEPGKYQYGADISWRKKIGFAFRERGLLSNLTLNQNLRLPVRYHGYDLDSGESVETITERAFKQLDIDEKWRESRPSDIPWGIRKKALIARSIVLSPKLLLMDSPLATVPFLERPQILKWIKNYKINGPAILIGTETIPAAILLADWILYNNEIIYRADFETKIDEVWLSDAANLKKRMEQE